MDEVAGCPGAFDGRSELSLEGLEVGPEVDLFAVENRLLTVGRGIVAVVGGAASVVGRGRPVSRGVLAVVGSLGAQGVVALE